MKYITISDFNKLNEYKKDWDRISQYPDSSFNYFISKVRSNPNLISPVVLIIMNEDRIEGIIAGYIEKATKEIINIKKHSLLRIAVKQLRIPFGCILTNSEEMDAKKILDSLLPAKIGIKYDVAQYNYLTKNSEIFKLKIDVNSKDETIKDIDCTRYYNVDLSVDQDIFQRRLNKYRRRSKTPDKFDFENISIRKFETKEEFHEFMAFANGIAQNSLKANLNMKNSFIYDEKTQIRYQESLEQEGLFCYVLFLDNVPCAYLVMYVYKGSVYFDQSGYLFLYRYCSPGAYLLIQVLQSVIDEKEYSRIDFAPGNSSFKSRLIKDYDELYDVYFYNKTIRSFFMKKLLLLRKFFYFKLKKKCQVQKKN